MKLEEAIDIGISDEDIEKLYEAGEIEDGEISQFPVPQDPNIKILIEVVKRFCKNLINTLEAGENERWDVGIQSMNIHCPPISLPEETIRNFSIRVIEGRDSSIAPEIYIQFNNRLERHNN